MLARNLLRLRPVLASPTSLPAVRALSTTLRAAPCPASRHLPFIGDLGRTRKFELVSRFQHNKAEAEAKAPFQTGLGSGPVPKEINYEQLKPITQHPSAHVLLIDVREPDEVIQGNIPSSVNIPLSQFEKALDTDDGDFRRIYGFAKPEYRQPLIFYCRSGVRSATAADLAGRKGYTDITNYKGSWLDWTSKEQGAGNKG